MPIELGEAVGVIAAQSIGEPGTQLTMRTFHTGGIASASGDIAGGLPRVVELFEARSPKGKAILARSSGVVRIEEDEGKGRTVKVVSDEGDEESYAVPLAARLAVADGDQVSAGDVLVGDAKTPKDPKELLDIKGVRETQQYLVAEVQSVYRDQGVSIHDKHIELIVRQMTKRILVSESGESEFLPGERVDAKVFQDVNRVLREEGKSPAEGRPELMGITKASLATDSWLSAASFQETTRVLTEAAIEGRSDDLLGLKENIIIGKLIPAGTGKMEYRSVRTEAPAYEPMAFYSSEGYSSENAEEQQIADWLAGRADFGDAPAAPPPRSSPCRRPRPAAERAVEVLRAPARRTTATRRNKLVPVRVRGLEFNVVDSGGRHDRLPFLWAHPLTSSISAEDRHRVFDWSEVRGERRWIRYDARGHGASSATRHAADYRWPNLAHDQLELLDALEIDRVVLGGRVDGRGHGAAQRLLPTRSGRARSCW